MDPTEAVVDDAIASGTDLLVVHHPLLLRGVDTVGAHTPKGALVHKLIKAGCALFSAHTNADSADPGVSDALAQALGLTVLRPIEPKPTQPLDKWVVMVPVENASAVQDALFEAGAGRIGDYSQCSWTVTGTGQFLPADGANPTIGTVGAVEQVRENRVEVIAPRGKRSAVLGRIACLPSVRGTGLRCLRTRSVPQFTRTGAVG